MKPRRIRSYPYLGVISVAEMIILTMKTLKGRWKMTDYTDKVNSLTESQRRVVDVILNAMQLHNHDERAKYRINQFVWALNEDHGVHSVLIRDIDLSSDEMYLDQNGDWWREDELYDSKRDLIESRLMYWGPLLANEINDIVQVKYFPRPQVLSSCCSVHTGTTEECHDR